MFHQREAAALSLDEIYDLGSNGLLELAQLDDRFTSHTLLSPQARRMDREGQTAEENRRLDETIAQLLLMLSPYFLLRPCHKVIEWLLRRFSIHRFNVLDVMAMCLPYHETVIASRLVQLLVVERTIFSFFDGVRKTGAPMPRSVLVERCAQSTNLLPFIFERVQASVALNVPNKALFALWGSVCVGVLRFRPTEETVRAVLALALDGLVVQDANVRASSHMALAQICTSSVLEQAPLDAIVASFELSDLLLLCLVFQSQPLARVTPALAKQLLSHPDALIRAGSKYDVSPMLGVVLRVVVDPSLAEGDAAELLALWKDSAASALVPLISADSVCSFVASVLLDCVRGSVVPPTAYVRRRLAVVLLSLGNNAGLGVAAALETCVGNAELHARLERLSLDVFGGVSLHSPLPGSATTLLLSLSHADSRVRQLGLATIDREVRAKRLDLKHLLVQSACNLVRDTDVQIAEFVLQCPWLSQAVPDALWDLVHPLLNPNHVVDQRLVRAALQMALLSRLPQAVGAALSLCVLKPKAESNPIAPFAAVLSACQVAVEQNGSKDGMHPVIVALASLTGMDGRSSKKHKSESEEAGLKSLVRALAEVARSKSGDSWTLISTHLFDHALLLVCRELLILPNAHASVAWRAVQISAEHTKNGLVKTLPSESAWKAAWAADLNSLVSDTIVVVTKNATLSAELRDPVFALLCKFESSDGEVAAAFESFFSRVNVSASTYLCSQLESSNVLVAVRALHLLEAVFQAAAAGSASELPKWLSFLLVPLQSSNGRIRRAALRCCARMAKAKSVSSATALLIKSVEGKSSEIKHSADALALAWQGLGKDALTWVAQQLEGNLGKPVELALLKSIRLVGDASRIALFESRLQEALEKIRDAEAQLLLEGLAGCGAALGKHHNTVALIVSALRSKDESIAKNALGVVSPAMWASLDGANKRAVLSGLCFVSATRGGDLASAAARVMREIGAARGTDIVAAELHLNMGGDEEASASKRSKRPFSKARLVEELSRLEVVLELLRASRGGDSVTALALLNLLSELSEVIAAEEAHIGPAVDYTVQLTLAALSPLVEENVAKLDDSGVAVLLRCLYVNHSPHLRKAVLSLLSSSADHDAMPVARQILLLFRADAKELVAIDNKASFRVMRSLLEKVLPHLSSDHRTHVLEVFVRALPNIPQHRRQVLLESAARFLPGQPLGRILAAVLGGESLEAGQAAALASELCRELGSLVTAEGLVDLVKRMGGRKSAPFVAATLSSDSFVNGCVSLEKDEDHAALQQSLGEIFQLMLTSSEKGDGKEGNESVFDAIDSVNELFTVAHFVEVVRSLLSHRNVELRLRATRVIAERVSADGAEGISKADEAAFVSLMPSLVSLMEEADDAGVVQAVLLALDILGRRLGASNTAPALAALNAVVRLISGKPKGELFATGLLTISALCAKLGPVVLPSLADALQLFLEGLKSADIAFVALSGLFEIVTSLGAFLGPFAEGLLRGSLHASLQKQPELLERSRKIADAFAHTLAPRLLAPVLQKLASTESSPESVKEVVRAAGFASSQTSRPGDLRALWEACIGAFESPAAQRDTAVIVAASDAAAEVAFHLSESEFRPLYAALLAGLAQDASKSASVFCVGTALLKRLRSLAVPWICKLSVAISSVLVKDPQSFAGEGAVELLRALFEADTDRAISKEVHAALMDPLVNTLDLDSLRDRAAIAIVEMAKSQANDALWKPLNYQILLKMRSRNSKVILACIKTIHEFWKTFKEDFLLLLPETMPFLGEVLEEDDDEVVKAAQNLLAFVNSFLPNSITF